MTPQQPQSAKRARPIVAIDGPVSAGKSTVARALARALGFSYLNTGAMYRAVAVAVLEAGIRPDDPELEKKIEPLVKSATIMFDGERLLLNGRDVTGALIKPEISDLASRFSTLPVVRARMRELQCAAGAAGAVVIEGRDIGTVIFPDAEFKFFLDGDLKVRAERRFAELRNKGVRTSLDEVLAQLAERDRRDSSREIAPLTRAPDAIVIDSTNLNVEQVVAAIRAHIERRSSIRRA